jgi:hypothetical protein
MSFQEEVKKVFELRKEVDKFKEEKKAAWEKFVAETAEINSFLKLKEQELLEAESVVRNLAVCEYQTTGNKNLEFGIKIKLMERINYDEKKALEWGLQHQLAIQLDKKAFESLAKSTPDQFAFVQITKEPMATIPAQLEVN